MDLSLFKNKYPFNLKKLTRNQPQFKRQKDGTHANIQTGEIAGEMAIVNTIKVSAGQFVKFQTDAIATIYGLKPKSRMIFDYLFASMQQNNPVVSFDLNILTSYFRHLSSDIKMGKSGTVMTHKTFYSSLKELQEKNIIAPTGNANWWYVNMAVIHNGKTTTIVNIIEKDIREKTQAEKNEERGQQLI